MPKERGIPFLLNRLRTAASVFSIFSFHAVQSFRQTFTEAGKQSSGQTGRHMQQHQAGPPLCRQCVLDAGVDTSAVFCSFSRSFAAVAAPACRRCPVSLSLPAPSLWIASACKCIDVYWMYLLLASFPSSAQIQRPDLVCFPADLTKILP